MPQIEEIRDSDFEDIEDNDDDVENIENAEDFDGDDNDDVDDETVIERLLALKEMFPEPVRNLTSASVSNSISLTKILFSSSKMLLWVFGSSFTALVLPVLCEQERSNLDELQAAEQRQILLGPHASVSQSQRAY